MRARSIEEVTASGEVIEDHVVVIGYGVAGRLVATTLRNIQVEHVIIELNADNVRRGREAGDRVFYADATSVEALGHAHAEHARCIVVMINDPQALYRVVDVVRRVAPDVPLIARTHYVADQEDLLDLGATRVVIEEVEGGIEVLAQVLRELDVSRNVIDAELDEAREATQASARPPHGPRNRQTNTEATSARRD